MAARASLPVDQNGRGRAVRCGQQVVPMVAYRGFGGGPQHGGSPGRRRRRLGLRTTPVGSAADRRRRSARYRPAAVQSVVGRVRRVPPRKRQRRRRRGPSFVVRDRQHDDDTGPRRSGVPNRVYRVLRSMRGCTRSGNGSAETRNESARR